MKSQKSRISVNILKYLKISRNNKINENKALASQSGFSPTQKKLMPLAVIFQKINNWHSKKIACVKLNHRTSESATRAEPGKVGADAIRRSHARNEIRRWGLLKSLLGAGIEGGVERKVVGGGSSGIGHRRRSDLVSEDGVLLQRVVFGGGEVI